MIRVGIVGGTGYTGVELLRILVHHPDAEVAVITSRAETGIAVSDLFPNLRGHIDLAFSEPDVEALAACDVVFFATPHGVAQNMMPELIRRDTRVIDLSADFRITDIATWEKWYGQQHACPELVEQAVYGLPELNRSAIVSAQLVACPGCYPTSIQLGLLPLLENNVVDPTSLIANGATGTTGAGRKANVDMLLAEASGSCKAYAVTGHRHLPEMEQVLRGVQPAGVTPAQLTFVPHLLPMVRGIHATLYATLTDTSANLQELFEQRYANEPFVDVMPEGSNPQTRSVTGSNMCRIGLVQPLGRNTVVIMSVIDNLAKGSSTQAVQNMNIMFGLDETTALNQVALLP